MTKDNMERVISGYDITHTIKTCKTKIICFSNTGKHKQDCVRVINHINTTKHKSNKCNKTKEKHENNN